MPKLPLPDFQNESEEADWYFQHRDDLDDYFEQTNDSRSMAQMLLEDHDLILDPNAVTISLQEGDLKLARQQASMRGVDDQKYLAELLHEALRSRAA